MKNKRVFIKLLLLIFMITVSGYAQFSIDLETGAAFTGYNDVRIPGNTGTLISLSEDFKSDPAVFYRGRISYAFSRNTFSILAAPLKINASGKLNKKIIFEDKTFPANTSINAKYRFNSYRLTYRYQLVKSDNIKFGLGLTAKIRDAEISLEGGGLQSSKTNVGFVPLINFNFTWKFMDGFGLILEGDALAAKQGRAEDILLALSFNATQKLLVKAGYRILEGGANNDEVYNFTLINYAAAGIIYTF